MSNTTKSSLPVVALTLGDPAGIGAELIARLLANPEATTHANIVLIGDPWLWLEGQRIADVHVKTQSISYFSEVRQRPDASLPAFLSVETVNQKDVHLGKAEAAGGRSVLQILDLCMDAVLAGHVDAICFAPLNKQAMKLGGLSHEDELHHFAEYLGVKGYFCEFNTLGNLWTSRISSHVPLKDVASYLSVDRITQASELIYQSLLDSGIAEPKVAIAAFNQVQPTKLRIAHHMHVPAQIIRAVNWKIPTIILIRNPKDAVLSLVMYDSRISIPQALKCYVSFYKTIYVYRAKYVIASFEEVITNYSSTIEKTNHKFGTKFVSHTPNGSDLKSIFRKIESVGKIEAIRQGETKCSELNIARPSSTRVSLKRKLLQKLKEPQNHEILQAAEKIYSEFIFSCS